MDLNEITEILADIDYNTHRSAEYLDEQKEYAMHSNVFLSSINTMMKNMVGIQDANMRMMEQSLLSSSIDRQQVDDNPVKEKQIKSKGIGIKDFSAVTQGVLGGLLFGPGLIATVTAIGLSFKAAANGATELQKKIDEIVQGSLIFFATFGKLGGIIKSTLTTLNTKIIAKIFLFGDSLADTFNFIGKMFGKLGGLIGGLLKPLRFFSRFFLPLNVIITAFDGLNAGYKEFKKSGDLVQAGVAGIKGIFDSIVTAFVGLYKIVKWLTVKTLGFFGLESAATAFFTGFENIMGGITSWLGTILEKFNINIESVSDVIKTVGKQISDSFMSTVNFLSGLGESIFDAIGFADRAYNSAKEGIANWLVSAEESVAGALNSVMAIGHNVLDIISWPMRKATDIISGSNLAEGFSVGIGVLQTTFDAMKNAVSSVVGWVKDVIEKLKGKLDSFLSKAKGIIEFITPGISVFNDEDNPGIPSPSPATAPSRMVTSARSLNGYDLQDEMRSSNTANTIQVVSPITTDASVRSSTQNNSYIIKPLSTDNTADPARFNF